MWASRRLASPPDDQSAECQNSCRFGASRDDNGWSGGSLYFTLGLLNGLGGLMALTGSSGEVGLEGVGLQVVTLLAMAIVSFFGFMSQAWAVLRAYQTLAKSP
ncbi:hypothetical protein [Phyllobacterium sp. K27]